MWKYTALVYYLYQNGTFYHVDKDWLKKIFVSKLVFPCVIICYIIQLR